MEVLSIKRSRVGNREERVCAMERWSHSSRERGGEIPAWVLSVLLVDVRRPQNRQCELCVLTILSTLKAATQGCSGAYYRTVAWWRLLNEWDSYEQSTTSGGDKATISYQSREQRTDVSAAQRSGVEGERRTREGGGNTCVTVFGTE